MKINAEALAEFDALSSLGESDLAMMAPALDGSQFRAGALVCREGDEGDCCYFLLQGSVAVSKVLPDGRRVRLAVLEDNTLFGQAGLVPNQVRTADVKAETEVIIATLSRRSLNWALKQGQDWAVAVQAIVAINLVRQLRSALDRLEDLAAAEDPSAQIEGRKRSEIKAPQSLDVNFGRARRKARMSKMDTGTQAPVKPSTDSDGYKPLPPVPTASDEEEMRTRDLLGLLAVSESSLSSAGLDLENIEFVFDEDQQRTADARSQG
jgi:CRP-like cAMP-binding protein